MLNLKVRLKNKTFLVTFLITFIGLIYNFLSVFNIFPRIGQDVVQTIIVNIVNLLALLGIVVDPTTEGIKYSERVLNKNDE